MTVQTQSSTIFAEETEPVSVIPHRIRRHWGVWFHDLKDCNVKRTRLSVFYRLGQSFSRFDALRDGMPAVEVLMQCLHPHECLIQFLVDTENVPMDKSRAAARELLDAVSEWIIVPGVPLQRPFDANRTLTQAERNRISYLRERFEEQFEKDHELFDVFAVTHKGLYSTRLLIESPEKEFSETVIRILPPQFLADFSQAARCLAFEIPTACAFYVCRATESLMLKYYEVLTGHAWNLPKNRDWNSYINHLKKEGAPDKITTRLDEIRLMERNSYAHPDVNVTVEEAPVLFKLSTAVVHYMAEEIQKKVTP